MLGRRERSIEPLFLNGGQINRKIKLIGEAPARHALRKDNGVGTGDVSGGVISHGGGCALSWPDPAPQLSPLRIPPGTGPGRAATGSREVATDRHGEINVSW